MYIYIYISRWKFARVFYFSFPFVVSTLFQTCCIVWKMNLMDGLLYVKKGLYKGEVLCGLFICYYGYYIWINYYYFILFYWGELGRIFNFSESWDWNFVSLEKRILWIGDLRIVGWDYGTFSEFFFLSVSQERDNFECNSCLFCYFAILSSSRWILDVFGIFQKNC